MTAALAPKVDAKVAPLYVLVDDYSRLLDMIAENGGDITPEVAAALDAADENIRTKMERTIRYVRNRTALRDAALAEARQLTDYAASLTAGIDGIKRMVLETLVRADIKKVETPIGTVRWQPNGRPSIAWDGPMDELPEEYRRPPVIALDGNKAYDAWKVNQLPPGFKVELGKQVRGL